MPFVSRSEFVQFVNTPWVFFFFCLTLTASCVLRHTITEKDNVLTWTKTKEKKIFILRGGKFAKKKKKSKRQRKSVRLKMSERIKK